MKRNARMKYNKICSVLALGAVTAAFLSAVSGCSDNDRSVETADNSSVPASNRCILAGELDMSKLASSELAPYIENAVTHKISISSLLDVDYDGEIDFDTLGNGDILVFNDVSELPDSSEDEADPEITLDNIKNAYENGAALVAIYPDSKDVEALNKLLGLSLSAPNEDASDPHFEFIGVAQRPLKDGTHHTFVYVAKCGSNHDYYDSFNVNSQSEDMAEDAVSGNSGDADPVSETAEKNADDLQAGKTAEVNSAEIYKEWCEDRVQAVVDWAAGLDERAKKLDTTMKSAMEKFAQKTDREDELLKLASGISTDQDDNISMSFIDYYNTYLKNSSREFKESLGLLKKYGGYNNESKALQAYRNISVKRTTHTHYQVISVHSFDECKDYYLVISEATTEPLAFENRADYGETTGGEILGYPSVLGYTRGLITDIWQNKENEARLQYWVPNENVNNSTTYTDSTGWSTTNGISVTGKGGYNQQQGWLGDISVGYNWSKTVSHNSSRSWTVNDYEIIPQPYTSDQGNRTASWLLQVAWPTYDKDHNKWNVVTAAKKAVTLNTECIFWADMSEADDYKLYGRTGWYEGFGGKSNTYHDVANRHNGAMTTLNIQRPLHSALLDATYEGSKDEVLYSANLLTESDFWTAKSDVSWLRLDNDSKSGTGSARLHYSTQANNTGKSRTGRIIITAGNDKLCLKFTQSSAGVASK